ncbi:hypothetical protein F4859DRAFT_518628 [Xylaria cf. heliscus]|nr:hypothetical protein F4859DRAFT_518628 [Xylaria cf. heliscus]
MSSSIQNIPYIFGISMHSIVHIEPDKVAEFLAAFRLMFEKAVAEPECLSFEVYQNRDVPGKLEWVESWAKGPEWFFETHMKKDYYTTYFAATQPIVLVRDYRVLERLGPTYTYVQSKSH